MRRRRDWCRGSGPKRKHRSEVGTEVFWVLTLGGRAGALVQAEGRIREMDRGVLGPGEEPG